MISLTRLSGTTFLLNADLIERVDCTPDTVVTLVDGTKYLVSQSLAQVLDSVIDYRAAIVARASAADAGHVLPLHTERPAQPSRLTAVPSDDEPRTDRHRGGTT